MTIQERLANESALYVEWTSRLPNVAELGRTAYSMLMDELEAKATTFRDIPRRYGHVVFHTAGSAISVRLGDWLDPNALVVGRI